MNLNFQKIKELNDYVNSFEKNKLIYVYNQINKAFELKLQK